MVDFWTALCLVAVLEGLILLVLPRVWKQCVTQMLEMPERQLRILGAVFAVLGVLVLRWIRD